MLDFGLAKMIATEQADAEPSGVKIVWSMLLVTEKVEREMFW